MDNTGTSNTAKTIGIVVIVLIILAGVWLMTKRSKETATPAAPAAQTAAPATNQDPAVSGIQSSGSSNASLDSDSAAIDAQMQGFSSDNAAAQSAN